MNSQIIPSWYNEYKKFIESSIESYLDTYLALPMLKPLEAYKQVVRYAFSGGKKSSEQFSRSNFICSFQENNSQIFEKMMILCAFVSLLKPYMHILWCMTIFLVWIMMNSDEANQQYGNNSENIMQFWQEIYSILSALNV